MNDITKHKFSDVDVKLTEVDSEYIFLRCGQKLIYLNKDDSTAISKHFYNQLSTFKRVGFINEIRGIEQTYKSLSLDKIRGRC